MISFKAIDVMGTAIEYGLDGLRLVSYHFIMLTWAIKLLKYDLISRRDVTT